MLDLGVFAQSLVELQGHESYGRKNLRSTTPRDFIPGPSERVSSSFDFRGNFFNVIKERINCQLRRCSLNLQPYLLEVVVTLL